MYAYCTCRHHDPKQVSSRGKLILSASVGQKLCEFGAPLIWYKEKTGSRKFRERRGVRYAARKQEAILRNIKITSV